MKFNKKIMRYEMAGNRGFVKANSCKEDIKQLDRMKRNGEK